MGDLEDLPERIAVAIPYFYYDLFGRIVPGLFLFVALYFIYRNAPGVEDFAKDVAAASTVEWIIGSMVGVVASFVVGFILSEATRLVFWWGPSPASLSALRSLFGKRADEKCDLETVFGSYFGFNLDVEDASAKYLIRCSRLCECMIISHNSALDAVNVRVAAEELMSRSLVIASAILAVISLIGCHGWLVLGYLVCTFLSWRAYRHYRDKSIREKFQMFYAIWCDLNRRYKSQRLPPASALD